MKRWLSKLFAFLGIMVIGDVFTMDCQPYKQNRKSHEEIYVSSQHYPFYSFHALVRAPTLNSDALINNNAYFRGINAQNVDNGFTPLYYLIMRPDATVKHLKELLERGADPTIRPPKKVRPDGSYVLRPDVYKWGIRYVGRSPQETTLGSFFETQCRGNGDVMKYLFNDILYKKLLALALQREEAEKLEKA